jgi:hypothetical protein
VAVAAAALAFAAFAANASAAYWQSSPDTMKWGASTNVTVEKNGDVRTCNSYDMYGYPPYLGAQGNFGGVAEGTFTAFFYCDGGPDLEMCACFRIGKEIGTSLYAVTLENIWGGFPYYSSPFGSYFQSGGNGTYNSATSTLTFNKATINTQPGIEPIQFSGSFKITKANGKKLTLVP